MFRKTLLVAALAALFANGASAAVSADEAKQLGTTLTAVGAEKAGNKDGTIPEYTGGLTTPPAGFQKGTNKRPDPNVVPARRPMAQVERPKVARVRPARKVSVRVLK